VDRSTFRFYSYAYPTPAGFAAARILPTPHITTQASENSAAYDAIRRAADPEATLMSFLESTYRAAADLASGMPPLSNAQWDDLGDSASVNALPRRPFVCTDTCLSDDLRLDARCAAIGKINPTPVDLRKADSKRLTISFAHLSLQLNGAFPGPVTAKAAQRPRGPASSDACSDTSTSAAGK